MTIFTGTAPSSLYANFLVELNLKSQDIANNSSVVSYKIYLQSRGGGYPYSSTQYPLKFYVDDVLKVNKTSSYTVPANGSYTLDSGEITVDHNSDGNKTFNFSGTFDTHGGQCSISGSYTLKPIPSGAGIRLTTTSNVNITQADIYDLIRIHADKVGSNFTYQLGVKITDNGGTLKTLIFNEFNTSQAYLDYRIPESWLSQYFVNAESKTAMFFVRTLSGSTIVSETTKDLRIYVPDLYAPTLFDTLIEESNTKVLDVMGLEVLRFYQNLSDIKVEVVGLGSHGSTIKSYKIEGFANRSQTTNIFNVGTPTTAGDFTIKATITDSRGKSVSESKTFTVVPYIPPTIDDFIAFRRAGTLGADAKLITRQTVMGGPNINPALIEIKYREVGTYTWTLAYSATSNASDFNQTVYLGDTFNTYVGYELLASITDKFKSQSAQFTLTTASITMAMDRDTNNVGFGKFPRDDRGRDGIDVKGTISTDSIVMHEGAITQPKQLGTTQNTSTAINPGFYSIRNPYGLPSVSNKYGSMVVMKADGTQDYNVHDDTVQLYIDMDNDVYVRNSIDKTSTFTSWKKLGVDYTYTEYPTGWVKKYDNGFMEQTVTRDLTTIEKNFTSGAAGFYGSKSVLVNYHEPFVAGSIPRAMANCYSSGFVNGFAGQSTDARCSIRLYSPNSASASALGTCTVVLYATGRWR